MKTEQLHLSHTNGSNNVRLSVAPQTPRLPPLNALSGPRISHEQSVTPGHMARLNQPLEMSYDHPDVYNMNGNYPFHNGGFGPSHPSQYTHFNDPGNSNYMGSLYQNPIGAPRTPQFTPSGPNESHERTQVRPQYPTTPVQVHGLPPPYTNHGNSLHSPQSTMSRPRHHTESTVPMPIFLQNDVIKFEDLPPRTSPSVRSINTILYGIDGLSTTLTAVDKLYVKYIKQEMISREAAEDNEGMCSTWDKIVKNKPQKLDAACRLILALFDRTLSGDTLTDRRISFHYKNPMHRFEALGQTLRTQKTICKHIMEDPYVSQVIDDPVGATRRVSNNRRVNDQKAKAINLGRDHLGLRGRGKGAPLEHISSQVGSPQASQNLNNNGAATESGTDSGRDLKPSRRARRKSPTKRARKAAGDDDDDDYIDESTTFHGSPPKRPRRNKASYKQTRIVQPALQLDTNVEIVSSDLSSDPWSSSTTKKKGPLQADLVVDTPQGHHHQHHDSVTSLLSAGLPSHNASPTLMPPAMQNNLYGLYRAQYAHPQVAFNPYPDHFIDEGMEESFNGRNVMQSIEQHERFFDLDGNDVGSMGDQYSP